MKPLHLSLIHIWHKVAFSMSRDDCMNYLGNSRFQNSIGNYAVYTNGGQEAKKLLPYKLK